MGKLPRDYDGSQYGIDLENTAIQKMAEAGATHAILQETVYFWLKGTTMFWIALFGGRFFNSTTSGLTFKFLYRLY